MNNSEQYRLECEARHWLHVTKYYPNQIKAQIEMLEQKRGKPQTALLEEMRRQWRAHQAKK